jgi:hypothetical protein
MNWFWNSLWWLLKRDHDYDGKKLVDPTRDRELTDEEKRAVYENRKKLDDDD